MSDSEMPLKEPEPKEGLGWATPICLTVIWFGAVAWYLSIPWTPPGEGKQPLIWLEKVSALDPSQFGDFLSGAFAPVAFFWLAYSVLIQKAELKLTREVMVDQEKALRLSSDSSEKLVLASLEQINKTKDSNIISSYNSLYNQLSDLLKSIRELNYYHSNGSHRKIVFSYTVNNTIVFISSFDQINRSLIEFRGAFYNADIMLVKAKNENPIKIIKSIYLLLGSMNEISKDNFIGEAFYASGLKDIMATCKEICDL